MPRHGCAGLAAQDVLESGLGAAFVPQAQEVLHGIGDAPAGKGIDLDVGLVLGGHFHHRAIPAHVPLVNAIDLLHERHLEVQPGLRDRIAHRTTELGQDGLLGLADRVESLTQEQHGEQREDDA